SSNSRFLTCGPTTSTSTVANQPQGGRFGRSRQYPWVTGGAGKGSGGGGGIRLGGEPASAPLGGIWAKGTADGLWRRGGNVAEEPEYAVGGVGAGDCGGTRRVDSGAGPDGTAGTGAGGKSCEGA